MKTLKFEHHAAEQIREGQKTATWRLYDDKNISVDDEIEVVDKVDPQKPETWAAFGKIKINRIIEKHLGEVDLDDMGGHKQYKSKEEMLDSYRKYYGPEVNFDTPVKIVHFSFMFGGPGGAKKVVENTTKLVEAKLYADGGSRGNPGPSASGFALMALDGKIVVKKGIYLGITTNNQAEYQALKLGLEEARKIGVKDISVFMDSLLVVNQMKGIFKVKNRDLWPIHDSIKQLAKSFNHISFTHVPRELNKIADREVNVALDKAARDSRAGSAG